METWEVFSSVEKGDLVALGQCLEAGCSVDLTNDGGATLVSLAAENGFQDIVEFLIERGANPNLGDKYGDVALNRAAAHGHVEIVRFLAEHGALVDSPAIGVSPLLTAAANGHLAVVKYLIEDKRISVNEMSRHMGSPIQAAACNGHLDVVQYLLGRGADPYQRDSMGHDAISMVQGCLELGGTSAEEKNKYNAILDCLRSAKSSTGER
jgi:ankyrin repeat protein